MMCYNLYNTCYKINIISVYIDTIFYLTNMVNTLNQHNPLGSVADSPRHVLGFLLIP